MPSPRKFCAESIVRRAIVLHFRSGRSSFFRLRYRSVLLAGAILMTNRSITWNIRISASRPQTVT